MTRSKTNLPFTSHSGFPNLTKDRAIRGNGVTKSYAQGCTAHMRAETPKHSHQLCLAPALQPGLARL